jgi:4-carboxymuconolactone decarboxylase
LQAEIEMRLKAPRIAPVDLDHLDEDQREALKVFAGRPLNIFRTLAQAPKALTRFLDWGNYVLSRRNSLPAREREIVILRTGWLCRSGYEFTQHRAIGLREGLTVEDIDRIKQGAEVSGWSAADHALIRATDELHADQFISDGVWADLSRDFDQKQRMDLVFTVGQYTQVSMMLNTFGVQLDEGLTLDPDFAAS